MQKSILTPNTNDIKLIILILKVLLFSIYFTSNKRYGLGAVQCELFLVTILPGSRINYFGQARLSRLNLPFRDYDWPSRDRASYRAINMKNIPFLILNNHI